MAALQKGMVETEESSISVHIAFLGAHFKRIEDMKFRSIETNLYGLYEWLSISGFPPISLHGAIQYADVQPIIENVGNGFIIQIGIANQINRIGSKRCINESAYVQFIAPEGATFEGLRERMKKFEDFLTLALSQPTSPYYARGIISPTIDVECSLGRKVEIYFPIINHDPHTSIKSDNLLFSYPEIQDKIGYVLFRWYFYDFRLQPGYDLYFGTILSQRDYDYNAFLNFMQSLESYHRLNFAGTYCESKCYFDLCEELRKVIPPYHKGWLENKLKYGNELNLRARLKYLTRLHDHVLSKFINDKSIFIDQAVTTRNYLTHYDEDLVDSYSKGIEFHILILKVRLLIEIIFLYEIGLSEKTIISSLKRQQRYKNLK